MFKEKSLYISGIFDMVSYNLNPSYIDIECMNKDYIETISKIYNIKKEDITLNNLNIDLNAFIKQLFNINNQELEHFLYLIKKEIGDCINIFELDKKILEKNNSYYPFFFLEEAYVLEFERMTICLLIGNNE